MTKLREYVIATYAVAQLEAAARKRPLSQVDEAKLRNLQRQRRRYEDANQIDTRKLARYVH